MKTDKKLSQLKELKKKILPEAKFWNRNRLFLAWAFCAAIILTTGIELSKMLFPKSILWVLGALFVFGLVLLIGIGKVIDNRANDLNGVLNFIKKEIRKLEDIKLK